MGEPDSKKMASDLAIFDLMTLIKGHQANLEQQWPVFAGDKQAVALRIVGDAVQHVCGRCD